MYPRWSYARALHKRPAQARASLWGGEGRALQHNARRFQPSDAFGVLAARVARRRVEAWEDFIATLDPAAVAKVAAWATFEALKAFGAIVPFQLPDSVYAYELAKELKSVHKQSADAADGILPALNWGQLFGSPKVVASADTGKPGEMTAVLFTQDGKVVGAIHGLPVTAAAPDSLWPKSPPAWATLKAGPDGVLTLGDWLTYNLPASVTGKTLPPRPVVPAWKPLPRFEVLEF